MASNENREQRPAEGREPSEAESRIGMSAEEEQREVRRQSEGTEPADEGVGALTDDEGREPDTAN